MSIYRVDPIEIVEDIPVFSRKNAYIENYEQISMVHLENKVCGIENPWVDQEELDSIDNSTIDLLRKYVAPGRKILDVGIGMAKILRSFPELDRYGVDISTPYLREAKRNGINVCFALVEDMPYQDELFDIVVCTDVLEHVLDLNSAIEKISRVLKTDGLLVIRTPYKENLFKYLDPNIPFEFLHLRNFDEFSLRLTFSKIFKFEFLEKSFAFFPPKTYRFKHNIKFHTLNRLLLGAIKMSGYLSKRLHRLLNEAYIRIFANEINIIFRKRSA